MITPIFLHVFQLKISFNESSLQSTYEYPSESSVWDSGEEEEEDKQDEKLADEQPSMVGRIHIPRASLTGSPSHTTNSNGEILWNKEELVVKSPSYTHDPQRMTMMMIIILFIIITTYPKVHWLRLYLR